MQNRVPMKYFLVNLFFIGLLFFSGCEQKNNETPISDAALIDKEPQAWIDAPLNEAHLPLAPYEIVFHISGQKDLSLGELVINDQVAALLLVDDPTKKLSTLRYQWEPDGPGKHILQTRAQTLDGEWSQADVAVVYIDVEETLTPTSTPTPEPVNADGITNVQVVPKQVNYGSCQPNQLTISAHAEDPAGVKVLSIFYRLSDASGNLTGWLNEAMNPISGGDYQKTINMTGAAEKLGFTGQSGTFFYQLIIQNQNGDTVRSDVFRDVSVARCAGFQMPLIKTVMPVDPLPFILPTVPYVK